MPTLRKKHISRGKIVLILLAVLVVLILGSFTLGRYPVTMRDLFGVIWSKIASIFGVETEQYWTDTVEKIIVNVRFPRIIIACLVGLCLSASGGFIPRLCGL